jgi:hypothetical protein
MAEVFTAPLAIIKVNGKPIGLMKSIRANEQFQLGEVKGIGRLTPKELPCTSWNGSLQCDFYLINLNTTGLPGALNRKTTTVEAFINNILLRPEGVDLEIMRKVEGVKDSNGNITANYEPFAQIIGLVLESDSFDIGEGQISGRNQSFKYLNPVIGT